MRLQASSTRTAKSGSGWWAEASEFAVLEAIKRFVKLG
jgi:hypothetical protein